MINVSALIQLKAYARQDGIFLALLWIASFLGVVLNPTSSWGSLLAMASPLLVGYLLVRFRNEALGGIISFRRALAFSLYTFFYASLLFAAAQYVYFRFFDNGSLMALFISGIKAMEPFYKAQGIPMTDFRQTIAMMQQLTPIEMAFVFMMQNFMAGFFLSLPIALVCRKSK